MERVAFVVALVVAVPLVAFVASGLVGLVGDLTDPCHEWGTGERNEVALDDECPSRSGTSMTRSEAVGTRIAFDGLLLYGAIVGVVGARRGVAALPALAATALLVAAAPAMIGLFGLPLLVLGITLLVVTRLVQRQDERPPHAARTALLALILLGILVLLHLVIIPDANPFFLVAYPFVLLLGGAAVWATWPRTPAPAESP